MSIETDLFSYFSTQWGTRTKITYPNTTSAQFGLDYTDDISQVSVSILDVGTELLSVPVSGSSPRRRFFILACLLIGKKDSGFGVLYGHLEQLDTIFLDADFIQGSTHFIFEESRRRPPISDPAAFVLPWECPFYVYIS